MAKRPRPQHLPAKLLAIRHTLGIGQYKLAKLLDCKVSASRISEYESGAREPNLFVLLAYARVARVRLEKIVDDNLTLN